MNSSPLRNGGNRSRYSPCAISLDRQKRGSLSHSMSASNLKMRLLQINQIAMSDLDFLLCGKTVAL
jgi:hypothetical protein